jgi:crotonobetainyl-CoA:carnitine CoA-transferase CaiB-like acyl-CoA transferase
LAVVPKRTGNAHPNIVLYQAFPVSDGHVIIAVGNDGQFASSCGCLGRPELAADERYRTNTDRVRNRAVLVPFLTGILMRR